MVNFIPDNKSSIENNQALNQIKKFFDVNFSDFELIEEYNSGNNYNGFRIQFKKQEVIIVFSSSWRGMEHEILVDGKAISLINFEPKMRDILSCSKKNLEYTLAVLKRYLYK